MRQSAGSANQKPSAGEHVLLVLTHSTRGDDEGAELTHYASGWHTHLAQLVAQLEGAPRPPFWALHAKLLADYEKLRAAGR